MTPIETNRLVLGPLQQQHWSLFLRLHTDPNVTALCFDVPPEAQIRQKFEARLGDWTPDSKHWLGLVVTDKASGEALGVTGFMLENDIAEVGYLFLPEYHGKGYAPESLQAVIEWASTTYHISQYRAVVTEGNNGSEKVLTKCGFTLHHIQPDAHRIGNNLFADHIYRLGLV